MLKERKVITYTYRRKMNASCLTLGKFDVIAAHIRDILIENVCLQRVIKSMETVS
jgi:hypothetical protein